MKAKVLRWMEFVFLFVGVPLLIYLDEEFIHPSMLVVPVLVFVFLLLRRSPDFRWRELVHWGITGRQLLLHGLIFTGMSLLALAYVYLADRENLFNLPRANPWIFVALCVFYPVFSAYGQEIIYRTFLLKRYARILGESWSYVLASGITFSFLHIVYYDPVSMLLTLVGGLYFARVYLQTRSVLFSAVLHGMYGIMIFGVGLGQYFWLDLPV